VRGVGRPPRLILLALVVLAGSASCGQSDVDRASYVQKNLKLLPTFPTPPGSRIASIASRPLRNENSPFGGSYVASYTTFVTYLTPARTRASDLARFYADDVGGWRRASRGVSASSGERSVCYRGTTASICVRWSPHFDRSEMSGVPFQVSFNYGGYKAG
jgi:hypothetical protein